jgi:hypothetical protein
MPEVRAGLILPSREDGMAIGVVDHDGCFSEDNVAALVGKRPQADEGMGKRDMSQPCCRGKEDANARVVLVRVPVGHADTSSRGSEIVFGDCGAWAK